MGIISACDMAKCLAGLSRDRRLEPGAATAVSPGLFRQRARSR
jgi:hypothetical protein